MKADSDEKLVAAVKSGDEAAVETLLANGANPNARFLPSDGSETPLPVLYAATGLNNYPAIARRLLEAGAKPNDGESVYHAAQYNHVECLEVLREFGAVFGSRDESWGNTPLYFLSGYHHPPPAALGGIRWLLENGADPNIPSYTAKSSETPLHAVVRLNWPLDAIELFVRHGADARIPRKDGRTAFSMAMMAGRDDVVALFRKAGMVADVSGVDQFIGACLRADDSAVRDWIRRDPAILQRAAEGFPRIVHAAAETGRAKALRLMRELGFDLARADEEGITPLHWAAWHGWAEAARELVAAGVPIDTVERRFNGVPIGWCSHGSLNCFNPRGDHAAVTEILAAAGAKLPPDHRDHWEASEPVLAVLRRHSLL